MKHILPPPEQATYHDIFAAGWNVRTSEPITDGTAGEDARAWYEQVWNNARGLPFTGDNVRLIMDGRKTATRRATVKVDQYKRLKPGDLIYVKETWAERIPGCESQNGITYRADHIDKKGDGPANPIKWKPCMFMPKWASRLWLQCTATWTERIWDITEDSAVAEGMTGSKTSTPREDYELLWDQINAKRGPEYRWMANPPVRVIGFRRIDR